MHLVEEPSVVDPTYIEDFLLTYRTFLSNPMEVGKKLLEWFQVDSLRDTVSLCASGQLSFSFLNVCVCLGESNEGKLCVFGPAKFVCVSVLMSLCVLCKEKVKWVS